MLIQLGAWIVLPSVWCVVIVKNLKNGCAAYVGGSIK